MEILLSQKKADVPVTTPRTGDQLWEDEPDDPQGEREVT